MAYYDYIPEKNRIIDNILKWLIDIIVVGLFAFFLCLYLGQRVEVIGSSMAPRLESNETVLIDKLSYRLREPERFDVIVYKSKEDDSKYYIKRIIGMPGEKVRIQDSTIYITGTDGETFVLKDVYCTVDKYESGHAVEPITVGSNQYFVLGDNRNLSEDSRFTYVGNVSRKDILGRAWFILSPIQKLGLIKK